MPELAKCLVTEVYPGYPNASLVIGNYSTYRPRIPQSPKALEAAELAAADAGSTLRREELGETERNITCRSGG